MEKTLRSWSIGPAVVWTCVLGVSQVKGIQLPRIRPTQRNGIGGEIILAARFKNLDSPTELYRRQPQDEIAKSLFKSLSGIERRGGQKGNPGGRGLARSGRRRSDLRYGRTLRDLSGPCRHYWPAKRKNAAGHA